MLALRYHTIGKLAELRLEEVPVPQPAAGEVLVNGASGGVGHITVQVARARGADVTATASAARRDFVLGLGASTCIDYRSVPMEQWPGGFDAVLDCVPNIPRRLHHTLLNRGGHYVTTIPGPATFLVDPLLNRLGRMHRHGVMLQPNVATMRELLAYTAQDRLRCAIEQQFPLPDAPAAVARSRSGRVVGKIVITGTSERSPSHASASPPPR